MSLHVHVPVDLDLVHVGELDLHVPVGDLQSVPTLGRYKGFHTDEIDLPIGSCSTGKQYMYMHAENLRSQTSISNTVRTHL